MDDTPPTGFEKPGRLTCKRIIAAGLIGLLCCLCIWIITPYNTFIMHLNCISGSYLPIGAVFILLMLILALNPILKLIGRTDMRLNSAQLAIILGMLLVASVLPEQGMLGQIPYMLAQTCRRVSSEKQLAEAYTKDPPASAMFPDRLGYKEDVTTSDQMQIELLPGNSIPWGSWIKPLLSWGSLMLVMGLMMVGMAIIVLPQWRYRERLAFPLVEVQEALIEQPDRDRYLAPVYRRTSFWVGVGMVFIIYLFIGGHVHFPERIPAIPVQWNLRRCIIGDPLLRNIPGWIYRGRIYFLFVAVAFFMPTRIGFSVWFTCIGYSLYLMISWTYMPQWHWGTIEDQRSGAMIVMTLFILWLGRRRWIEIGKAMLNRTDSEEARRDRKAGFMFLAGIGGLLLWFIWAGADFLWALLFVGIGFMVSLLITRMIAETGIPFMRIYDCQPRMFMEMAPNHIPGPATILVSGIAWVIFQYGSRVNTMTMAAHGLALGGNRSPASQTRRGLLLVAVLVAGLTVCGSAHIYFAYHHSVSLDGENTPISPSGSNKLNAEHDLVLRTQKGRISRPIHNRVAHIAFGGVLAGFLWYLCMFFPKWPLHPVGILISTTYYGKEAWPSIFLGWLTKILLVRFGGSRLYLRAKPFFLGLIVGEVFAVVFWGIIPAVMAGMGLPYERVLIQPI